MSTESTQIQIDLRKIRVHHAAATIAFYVRTAGGEKFQAFLRPICDHPTFSYYWNQPHTKSPFLEATLTRICLEGWPVEKLEFFNMYPVIRLFERHVHSEQHAILGVLKEIYGFNF